MMTGAVRLKAMALGCVAAVLIGLCAPVLGAAGPGTGARGIGDSYFPLDGNGGVDVTHYDVRVRYSFSSRRLEGRAVLTLVPTVDLARFNLDLLLRATGVSVDGRPARHRRDGKHELVIRPAKRLQAGVPVKVVVRYRGRPGEVSYRGEKSWAATRHEVAAVNQPHVAALWFPANDHPSDKATFEIAVTVPRGKEVISNGHLVRKVKRSRTATWHWRSRDPMATYLAYFVAGDFTIEKGERAGRPWLNAVSQRLGRSQQRVALRQLRRGATVVARLEKDLGPYPFETTGGVVTSLDLGFALENQTRPVYAGLARDEEWLVVHELAHQWFGDSVSLRRWRDIWLNEGAATFMELRSDERTRGIDAEAWLDQEWGSYGPGHPMWRIRIGDPGPSRLFADAVYVRGGMTMQALRNRIGERDFWTLLRTWLAEHRNSTATGRAFEKMAASVSGQDLDSFFDAWLRTPRRPARTADNGLAVSGPATG
ncbi:M1 family metallopeptidase [Nocardioides gilvus]|uniref:M1 family metallopeptidase n=1 Tax=Nocardioides gilvus TaxID=1735589 RepID=UPI000D746C0D|nr:M1 family metallopeptidase [Nocardioides gilvus]